jgi:hypothetical protein
LEKFVDSTAELFLPVRGWSAKIFFVGEHLIHRKWTLPISALMKARSALVVERLGGYLEPGQLEASPIQNLPGSFLFFGCVRACRRGGIALRTDIVLRGRNVGTHRQCGNMTLCLE